MKRLSLLVLLLAACAAPAVETPPVESQPAAPPPAMIKSLTPILCAESIAPCLPLWERLGFTNIAEVPGEDGLAFVMLQKDGVMVMYQSLASIEADLPVMLDAARVSRNFLYLEVEDLDALKPALEGQEVVVPERTTFYGKREIAVRDAAGHVIILAQDASDS